LRRPSLALAVAINRAVREPDEWFDEPDDLERVARAVAAIDAMDEPVEAAAVLACRVARAQGFTDALAAELAGEEPERWLVIGPDQSGSLLEVIVMITAEGDQIAIRAMPMRLKYRRLLES